MNSVPLPELSGLERAAAAVPVQGKILLMDSSTTRRGLRARSMKTLGIKVDCAAGLADARLLWQPGVYELVLIDLHNTSAGTRSFCEKARAARPNQRIAFYVGSPTYLSHIAGIGSSAQDKGFGPWTDSINLAAAEGTPGARGSICEAAWRISAGKSMGPSRSNKPISSDALREVSFGDAIKQAERAVEVHA